MKLVVGLGNPGREYKDTRHNIGFMVLDNYLGKVRWKSKMESYIYIDEENDTIFMKPLTYMNLSGLAVSKVMNFYKIDIDDLLVIQDDLDLQIGMYKIKKNSSSGGHNGIKSIINEIKTESFARLKVGIGKSETIPTDKYVLGKFTEEEINKISSNFNVFDKIIIAFIKGGIEEVLKINTNH